MRNEDGVLSHVLFYFSGTGNTWWVARELSRQLGERGLPGKAVSIEAVTPTRVKEYISSAPIVGFGYPVHCSDLPQPMKDFIGSLPPQQGKAAFVFCTQWLWSGDGAYVGALHLTRHGLKVGWGEHFLMPNNVCVTAFHLPYTNDSRKIKPVLARAERRINRFARMISEGRFFCHGFNKLSTFLGALQRVPFSRIFPGMRDDIGVEESRCSRCGICIDLCPVGNLKWNGKEIVTEGVCIICLRCYCFCPEIAITYRRRPHNLKRGNPYRGPVDDFIWEQLF